MEDDVLKFHISFKPKFINLPDIETKQLNVRYPLVSPFAFAHIFIDRETKELLYNVEEPILTDDEKSLLKLLQLGLEEVLNMDFVGDLNKEKIISYLEDNTKSILAELGARITPETYQKLMYYIYRDSVGFNKVEPLLNDYYIEDIECNGVNSPIYIVHRVYENMRTNIVFDSVDEIRDFVEKLAQKCGKYISYAQPFLDAALPDGSRVNASYSSDITTKGPTFTIRKFTEKPLTPVNLIMNRTLTPKIAAYFWLAIDYKMNLMAIGETASGKTTFLNSILHFIPSEARIASIEDTREINLAHSNWIPAVSRVSLGSKVGDIDLFSLLKETFRQNPDYVVVGEVRGKETFVLFQGMASGHSCYSTFHAGSFSTLVRRLETPPINLPPELVDSLDIITSMIHIKERDKNIRRVQEVDEILPYSKDENKNVVFKWDAAKDIFLESKDSIILKKIHAKTGKSLEELRSELRMREKVLIKLAELNITDYKKFSEIIDLYYHNREKVLKSLKIR